MRNGRTDFERPEIWCSSTKAISHSGQNRTSVHWGCSGLQPKIEIFSFIEFLQRVDVLCIQAPDVHEDVVIDENAIAILAGGLAVFGKGRILAGFKVRAQSRPERIHRDVEWR